MDLFFEGIHQTLNSIDLLLIKVGFAALLAHPGRHRVEGQVAALSVDVEGCSPLFHDTLAVNAPHDDFLVVKSADHSSGSGR